MQGSALKGEVRLLGTFGSLRTSEEHDFQKGRQCSLEDCSAREKPHVDTSTNSEGADEQRKRDWRNHERQELVKVTSQAKTLKRGPDTFKAKADRKREDAEDALDLIGQGHLHTFAG